MELEQVEAILEGRGEDSYDVMEVLQDIQQQCGYLSEEAMCLVSERLNVPVIEVFRLANFYKAFSLEPRGRHLITVCMGTACHVQGAPKLVDEVLGQLKIAPGETTEDKAFTVETVNCVGACALAPVLILDGEYHGHLTPSKLRELLERVRQKDQQEVANA
ncbi:NAD(P)H-dependent oxidoreductase subunit E [bacterium]|nr:NAD(P)H-dependent oxidoreductase subunit E [bacterium]